MNYQCVILPMIVKIEMTNKTVNVDLMRLILILFNCLFIIIVYFNMVVLVYNADSSITFLITNRLA